MTETKHTPTPWKILPEEVDKSYIRIRGTRLGGRYKIANVLTPIHDGAPQAEANETRANAEFIVHACNLHEDFLDFVQGVSKCELGANGQFNFVIECARELLAKARGEA